MVFTRGDSPEGVGDARAVRSGHGSTECSERVGYLPLRVQLTEIPLDQKVIPFAVVRSKHFVASCDGLPVLGWRSVGGTGEGIADVSV
jgi:hypothetical protein